MVMEHKNFNAWLASAARVIAELAGRPVNFVDVGAGVGDTVALVHEQLGVNLGSCICIDGAEDNRPLLEHNLAFHPSVEIVIAMLAARPGSVPSLVRHHAGTAAALGSSQATARTLDEVLASIKGRKPCDLLKIDTDGFDGEVLAGAMDFLRTERPVLCFEWHPALVERCGRAYSTAFEVLRATDYTALIWLRNTGSLSHWTVSVPESVEIEKLDRLLRTRNQPFDPHYDIIALPREKAAWLDALVAEMPFP
jgi:FkbM family methyltransferase